MIKDAEMLNRAEESRFFLFVHGLLTERENEKVKTRVKTQAEKAGMKPVLKHWCAPDE